MYIKGHVLTLIWRLVVQYTSIFSILSSRCFFWGVFHHRSLSTWSIVYGVGGNRALQVQSLVIRYHVSEVSDASTISPFVGRVLFLISAEAEMSVEVCLCTPMRLAFPLLTVRSLLSFPPPSFSQSVFSMEISKLTDKLTDKMETITNKQTIADVVTNGG